MSNSTMTTNVQKAADLLEDGFTTIAEAAVYLNLSRAKIYVMMDAGELVWAKFGRSRRLPWKGVRDYAAKCMVCA